MRRFAVIVAILICACSPITAFSSAEIKSVDNLLEIQSSDEHIIHRGETIEATITIKNQGSDTTIIDFFHELPNNISISNLPEDFTLVSGQVRQFRIYFTCDDYAPYETVSAYVNITSDIDDSTTYSTEFNLIISKQSDLRFGVSDDSEFIVDPGLRTNLAVNMTNYGNFDDDVSFSITTNSGWSWGWNMDVVENGKAIESFSVGQLKFARLWIEIPQVIDSNPLYLSGPRFSLTATSSLDRGEVTWSFNLLMSEFRNVTLDDQGDNLQLDPDSNDRIPITIKNSGNIENRYNLELQITDATGNIVDNIPASDRIEYNGWIVAIFGGYEEEFLTPTDTRTFEVGFQSPNQNSGEIHVKLNIIPAGATMRSIGINLISSISWDRDFVTELVSEDCTILPSENCNPSFRITNNGNYQDQFLIEAVEIPAFVTLENGQKSLEIPKNSHIDINDIIITANQGVEAFSNSQVIFKIQLINSPSNYQNIAINVVIAPKIDWSIQDLTEENDALGRYNIAMTLRNDGNAADGIIVQLQCSHFTPMTLIPPTNSIIETGVEFPRSFEINNIDFGANFTVRAWAEIPTDQTSNGTMYLNISIRSSFSPDDPISFTTEVDYLGVSWQKDDPVETDEGLSKILSDSVEFALAWKWIMLSILASMLIIGKAFTDRRNRNNQAELMSQLRNQPAVSQPDDWMAKFTKSNKVEQNIESPRISPQNFERGFKRKSSGQKPVTIPVEERLRDAAALVLDTHDRTSVVKEADQLLDSINITGINSPLRENSKLELRDYSPNMTKRNDPQNLLNDRKVNNEFAKQVPLPDDDELDF
jgi:hypothetical protein